MKKLLVLIGLVGITGNVFAAPVVWDVFYQDNEDIRDVATKTQIEGIGVRGYCAEEGSAYMMADVGLGYQMKDGVLEALVPALFSQTMTGKAMFVLAFAGDVITDDYLNRAQLVSDYRQGVGVSESYGTQSIDVASGESVYLAFTARGFVLDEGEAFGGQEDLYGWVRLDILSDHAVLGASAFCDWQGLVVGTDQAGGAIPEPSSGVLLLLGMGLLCLKRD